MPNKDSSIYEARMTEYLSDYQKHVNDLWQQYSFCQSFFENSYPLVADRIQSKYYEQLRKWSMEQNTSQFQISTPVVKFSQLASYETCRHLLEIAYYEALMKDFASLGFVFSRLMPSPKYVMKTEYLDLLLEGTDEQVQYYVHSAHKEKTIPYRLYTIETHFQLSKLIDNPFQKVLHKKQT